MQPPLVTPQEVKNRLKEQYRHVAVFPCRLQIMENRIFSKRNPIVIGVKVIEGVLRAGTPLCVPKKVENKDTGGKARRWGGG